MAEIAAFIAAALRDRDNPATLAAIRGRRRRALRPLPRLPPDRGTASRSCRSRPNPRDRDDPNDADVGGLVGSRAVPSTGDYLLIGAVAGVATFLVTPLVAALARWRGWLYEPNDRTVHTQPIPAFGGLAMYVGFLVALGDGPADGPLRPAVRPQLRAAGRPAGGDDHRRRRAVRRHQGPLGAGQGHRHRRRRPGARVVRRDDVLLPAAVPRRVRPVRRLDPAGHRAVAARHDPGDQPDRRARRAGRRHRRHRRRRVLPLQPAAQHARAAARAEHRPADGDHRRRAVRRLPARTTSTRRASSWATAAPCCSAC